MIGPLFSRLANIGARPDESDDERTTRLIYVAASFASVPALLLYARLFLYYGAPHAALAMFGYLATSVLCLVLFTLTRRNLYGFIKIVLGTHLLASLAVTFVAGGITRSAVHGVWGLLSPLVVLVVYPPRTAIRWFVAYLILLAVCLVISRSSAQPLDVLGGRALLHLSVMNITGVSMFTFAILYYFVRQRDLAFRLLRRERERSEELLLNILPRDIAAMLKDQPQTIAQSVDGASILFADVVDFTPIAARLTATETVNLLNEVFSYFDTLVEKHDVEKIKTIGDCYMVASGVPRPRQDHAQVLARMALEMRDYVRNRDFNGHKLSFRIGINSGPVVAGVIGRKKFIYDLWGDAVNTASRMESHGTPGEIQITRATYELIKDEFDCRPGGSVEVKGKGEMEVWRVYG